MATPNYMTIIESQTPDIFLSLKKAANTQGIAKNPIGDIMQWTAIQLLGKPYVGRLLDNQAPEYLYVSLNSTDCMLFIEEVFAYAKILKDQQYSINNFSSQIKDIRYHGNIKYCNRNHYFKDWAINNINQGLFVDVAKKLTNQYLSHTADVLSKAIANLPAHINDVECIKSREAYINTLKLGFIPLKDLPKYLADIKAGDIIGIIRTPNGKADSVYHLGIAYLHDGKVGMIDASSSHKKVIVEDTLTGYLTKFKNSEGIILLRAM
jgi:hypothetical protein